MSDFFGIGAALKALHATYASNARGSGRTTRLVRVLQPGDRVITQNVATQRELQRLLRERGLERDDVEIRIVPAENPHRVHELPPARGRTYFDHVWVEAAYRRALSDTDWMIRDVETRLSNRADPPALRYETLIL